MSDSEKVRLMRKILTMTMPAPVRLLMLAAIVAPRETGMVLKASVGQGMVSMKN